MATSVERTVKYSRTVDELTDAWAFVLAHLDSLGPDPSIHINPAWWFEDDDDGPPVRRFEATVLGTVTEEESE